MENANEITATYPTGWRLRKTFIDINGTAYQYGKRKPEMDGGEPTIVMKDGKQIYPVIETAETQAEQTVATETSPEEKPTPEPEPEKPTKHKKEETSENEIEILKTQNLDLMERLRNLESLLMNNRQPTSQVIVKEEKKPFGNLDTKDIAPDDFEASKTTYTMFGRGFSMSSYINDRGGVIISPYNTPVYFKKSFDDVRHIEGQNRVIPFCSYQTHSKKEREFIEGHPLYGILIFSKHENAVAATLNDNVVKLESIVNKIQGMDKKQLFVLASQYGIDHHLDITEIKSKIMWQEISKEIESEKVQQTMRVNEMERERKMFKEA